MLLLIIAFVYLLVLTFSTGVSRNPRVPPRHSRGSPEVVQMLRSTVNFNSPVQICEQGFLKPLECILGGSAPPKRLKNIDLTEPQD